MPDDEKAPPREPNASHRPSGQLAPTVNKGPCYYVQVPSTAPLWRACYEIGVPVVGPKAVLFGFTRNQTRAQSWQAIARSVLAKMFPQSIILTRQVRSSAPAGHFLLAFRAKPTIELARFPGGEVAPEQGGRSMETAVGGVPHGSAERPHSGELH
jgi:hypothetical protein